MLFRTRKYQLHNHRRCIPPSPCCLKPRQAEIGRLDSGTKPPKQNHSNNNHKCPCVAWVEFKITQKSESPCKTQGCVPVLSAVVPRTQNDLPSLPLLPSQLAHRRTTPLASNHLNHRSQPPGPPTQPPDPSHNIPTPHPNHTTTINTTSDKTTWAVLTVGMSIDGGSDLISE